jgi:hypothetical protein
LCRIIEVISIYPYVNEEYSVDPAGGKIYEIKKLVVVLSRNVDLPHLGLCHSR